jgi:hypothetical protein
MAAGIFKVRTIALDVLVLVQLHSVISMLNAIQANIFLSMVLFCVAAHGIAGILQLSCR